MKGSRRVLVKVVLFQLRGHGHPQDYATPNFFANSKRPILGLSNEVSFVPEILWKDDENKGNVFPCYASLKQELLALYPRDSIANPLRNIA